MSTQQLRRSSTIHFQNPQSVDNGELRTRIEPSPVALTVVVPMRNEVENVAALYAELREVLDTARLSWEAVFVDDGSHDGTVAALAATVDADPRVTIVQLARRFGQSAAMSAGMDLARGHVIIPMDADLQNDPHDIPMLLAALDEGAGYDIVSGWRKRRHDRLLSRRVPSLVANRLIAWLTWTPIHDFGCTLKAYRSEVLDEVRLYGEMHRFLPALCQWRGARITERVVNHRPRLHGKSKYGLRRTVKVMLDLVTVKFLGDYLTKPLYFFGKLAMLALAGAGVSFGVALLQKYGYLYPEEAGLNLNRNVLVLFAMMLFLSAVMSVMMGVICELLVRIYHESQGRRPYRIRSVARAGATPSRSPMVVVPISASPAGAQAVNAGA